MSVILGYEDGDANALPVVSSYATELMWCGVRAPPSLRDWVSGTELNCWSWSAARARPVLRIKMGEVKGPSHTQANAVRACETTDMQ